MAQRGRHATGWLKRTPAASTSTYEYFDRVLFCGATRVCMFVCPNAYLKPLTTAEIITMYDFPIGFAPRRSKTVLLFISNVGNIYQVPGSSLCTGTWYIPGTRCLYERKCKRRARVNIITKSHYIPVRCDLLFVAHDPRPALVVLLEMLLQPCSTGYPSVPNVSTVCIQY